jgi:hypothetical protein
MSGVRSKHTRRKYLAGVVALQLAESDAAVAQRLTEELEQSLVRNADRALFGLPPVQKRPPRKPPSP